MRAFHGYLVVFLGAGVGGALRHAVNRLSLPTGSGFPLATWAVNVSGCLVMGVVVGWFAFRGQSGQLWRLFLTTGILGGYTTFSTFSLEVMLLWERGRVGSAIAYVVASVVVSIVAVFAGAWLVRHA